MLNKFLFSGAIAHSVLKSENYWHVTSSRREKCTSSQVHFISKGTSSHKSFHPICYFILYVTSSHRSFHPIRHFILWLIVHESFNPTSDFIPVNISRLILFFHFIPPTTFTPPVYFSLRDEVSWKNAMLRDVVPVNQLTPIRESWKKIQKPGTELASFLEKNPTKIKKIGFWELSKRHFWKNYPKMAFSTDRIHG